MHDDQLFGGHQMADHIDSYLKLKKKVVSWQWSMKKNSPWWVSSPCPFHLWGNALPLCYVNTLRAEIKRNIADGFLIHLNKLKHKMATD